MQARNQSKGPDSTQQTAESQPLQVPKAQRSRKSSVSSTSSGASLNITATSKQLSNKPSEHPFNPPNTYHKVPQQVPTDFSFMGNYREALANEVDISPSSSNTSLASYFKRANSSGHNSLFPSISQKPSSSSIATNMTASSNKHSRPSALTRIKNTVIRKHRHKTAQQEQPGTGAPLSRINTPEDFPPSISGSSRQSIDSTSLQQSISTPYASHFDYFFFSISSYSNFLLETSILLSTRDS